MTLSDPPNVIGGRVTSSSPEPTTEATTVRHLVDVVGSPVLHVLAAPNGIDRRVRATVLHDPVDELADEPDALLLMAGLRADSQQALELVGTAAGLGYCAVVVKRRGADVTSLVAEASVRGVIVLAVADEVPWRHLDALLLSVLGSQGLDIESAAGAGDELFALANAIAAVVGGSVAIEDMDRRVVAYSSMTDQRIDALREQGILDRRVPDMDRNPAQYHAVLAASGVVRFEEKSDEFARAAIAIKAGSRPLGTIWAIESASGIDAEGERALTEGSRLAALTILRSLNASGLELQLREGALLRALDGSLSASETTFRLSLPGGGELALVGFAATPDADGSTPLISHVASALSRYVAAYRPDAAMATTSRTVYVLLPGGGDQAASRFASGALSATHASFPGLVRVAIARTSTDPADLPEMRTEIDDVLRVTTTQPDLPIVARLDEVHNRVLLAHLADLLVHEPRLGHPGVAAMVEHDRTKGTDYARSVTTWLDSVGEIAVAAAALDVHPNTLRYRLRRATELFELALDHPDDRLSVWMQLRLRRR
jgi:hypothetical protein